MFDWYYQPVVCYQRISPKKYNFINSLDKWRNNVDCFIDHQFDDFWNIWNTSRLQLSNKASNQLKEDRTKTENNQETQPKGKVEQNHPKSRQIYSIKTSIYRGNDGTEHIYREERDNELGQRKTIETRRIGKQSMTLERIEKENGEIEEEETRKNIKENEIEEFKKQWERYEITKTNKEQHPNTQSIEMKEKKKLEEEQQRKEEVEQERSEIDEKIENK
jgi:hypothetical protein